MTRPVTALIALSLALPLFASHPVTPPTYGPAVNTALPVPLLASNGNGFLATWAGSPPYATTIAPDGTVTSPVSYPIAVSPLALFDHGSEYAAITRGPNGGLQVVVLSKDAREIRSVRDLPGAGSTTPKGASNGSDILVVDRTAATVARLIRADGSIVTLPANVEAATSYDVASVNGDFLLATVEPAGVFVQSIRDGAVAAPGKTRVSTDSGGPIAVASSGNEIVVIYITSVPGPPRQGSQFDLRSAALQRDGTVTANSFGRTLFAPFDIVWAGNSYVAATLNMGYRLDRNGNVTDYLPAPTQDVSFYVALAARGTFVYALLNGSAGTLGVPITSTSIGTPVLLSVSLRTQADPAITSDGFDFLVAWADNERISHRLATIRLGPNGDRLDPAQRDVYTQNEGYSFARKRIAFGSGRYLLTATGFLPSPAPSDPRVREGADVAWDGQRFFVVTVVGSQLLGTFVSQDGTESGGVIATPGFISSASPRVAFDGMRFLVIWVDNPVHALGNLYGIRVARDGIAIDAAPVLLGTNVLRARVASDGKSFAVVADSSSGTRLTHIDASGSSLAIGASFDLFAYGAESDITFDGTTYIAGWRRSINFTALSIRIHPDSQLSGEPSRWFVGMARAGSTGAALPVGLETEPVDISSPLAMASNQVGDTILVSTIVERANGVTRLHAYPDRELKPLPPPPLSPENVVARATTDGYIIEWTSSDSTTVGFRLYAGDEVLGTFPAHVRSVRIRGTLDGMSIRAINEAGASEAAYPLWLRKRPK